MRTAALVQNVTFTVRVPLDLKTRMDLMLYSEVEGKVPYGEHAKFLARRIREYFEWKSLDLAPWGIQTQVYGDPAALAALETKLKQQGDSK